MFPLGGGGVPGLRKGVGGHAWSSVHTGRPPAAAQPFLADEQLLGPPVAGGQWVAFNILPKWDVDCFACHKVKFANANTDTVERMFGVRFWSPPSVSWQACSVRCQVSYCWLEQGENPQRTTLPSSLSFLSVTRVVSKIIIKSLTDLVTGVFTSQEVERQHIKLKEHEWE